MNNLILLISFILIASPAFSKTKEAIKEEEAQNKWYRACESSKHPAIVKAKNKLYMIRQKIQLFQSVSPEYKQQKIARKKFLTAKGDNKWALHSEFQKATDKWFQKSKSLDDQRLKAWGEFYGKACESNYDPNVTKAREEYNKFRDKINSDTFP